MLASLAAAQNFAAEQLASSPRHHEWVKIAAGERRMTAFVAYPERSDPTPVVIFIHKNRGLTNWVRAFADQFAARGVIAIALDLLSDFDDTRHSMRDFASSDAARQALYRLPAEQIERDLAAVQRYVSALPAAGGAIAAAGFCWGDRKPFVSRPRVRNLTPPWFLTTARQPKKTRWLKSTPQFMVFSAAPTSASMPRSMAPLKA